jgi:hypothetical protein
MEMARRMQDLCVTYRFCRPVCYLQVLQTCVLPTGFAAYYLIRDRLSVLGLLSWYRGGARKILGLAWSMGKASYWSPGSVKEPSAARQSVRWWATIEFQDTCDTAVVVSNLRLAGGVSKTRYLCFVHFISHHIWNGVIPIDTVFRGSKQLTRGPSPYTDDIPLLKLTLDRPY